jgi:hypothetical protein
VTREVRACLSQRSLLSCAAVRTLESSVKHIVLLSAFALSLLACPKDASPDRPKDAPSSDVHAPAGVKPGSHEDWCGEHGVPESQCTRCHPELAAAFKATNDWCDEHGLPESHCLKCHPDLKITRPPKGS